MRLFEHQQLIDSRVCWPVSREKRDETSAAKIRREIEGCNDSIPEWRDGAVPEGRDGVEKGRPQERGGKSAKRSERRETNTIKMRGPKKAIVRSQKGEAEGRVDWKRHGWPDAKFEMASAKCDL